VIRERAAVEKLAITMAYIALAQDLQPGELVQGSYCRHEARGLVAVRASWMLPATSAGRRDSAARRSRRLWLAPVVSSSGGRTRPGVSARRGSPRRLARKF
jgi:hypothetical protein